MNRESGIGKGESSGSRYLETAVPCPGQQQVRAPSAAVSDWMRMRQCDGHQPLQALLRPQVPGLPDDPPRPRHRRRLILRRRRPHLGSPPPPRRSLFLPRLPRRPPLPPPAPSVIMELFYGGFEGSRFSPRELEASTR